MLKRKSKLLLIKIFSLFSVVRGYNIPVVVLAQYLSSIFILSPEKRALDVILDWRLFLLVFVSTLTISSGYIINNFYDSEKDLINRPNKTRLDRQVSQTTKLQVYFVLNFLATALSLIISFRAALFFATYIFLIWFYSHKLKKYPIVGNLTASLLAVLPFFGILLYFKNFYHVIFAHAMFLFLLLFIREMIKDLENIKGDIANNYQTIPVRFGERVSKQIITFLTISTIIPVYILIEKYDVGYMDIYFYISLIILILFLLKL
ncbi:geranylgeranylglycerol-phosphate geranylgeranyltransferase, partial [Flavobacterium psychrophilum]